MKQINWQQVANIAKEHYPNVLQIAAYSRNRWLLVFEDEPDNFLETFHPLTKIIDKHKLTVPLVISKSFIQSSLDSYPLEFMDIQSDYTNYFSDEDVITNLSFDKSDVRLQIERELKSKWLLTRLAAIQHKKHNKMLFGVLRESYTSLIPVFKGFTYLNGIVPPNNIDKLMDYLQEILHSDLKVLKYLAEQKKAPSENLVNNLFNDYLRLLNLCIEKIDTWKTA